MAILNNPALKKIISLIPRFGVGIVIEIAAVGLLAGIALLISCLGW